jgi:hypothetical protein
LTRVRRFDRFHAAQGFSAMHRDVSLIGADGFAEGWGEFFSPPESISIWTKTDARGRDEFKKE